MDIEFYGRMCLNQDRNGINKFCFFSPSTAISYLPYYVNGNGSLSLFVIRREAICRDLRFVESSILGLFDLRNKGFDFYSVGHSSFKSYI